MKNSFATLNLIKLLFWFLLRMGINYLTKFIQSAHKIYIVSRKYSRLALMSTVDIKWSRLTHDVWLISS